MLHFKDLEEVDIKLILNSGSGFKVDNLEIIPYTTKEVVSYGYTNYMKNLQWISVSVDDFINSTHEESKKAILEEGKENLKVFDFFISLGGDDLKNQLLVTLAMIFRTDDVRFLGNSVVALDFEKLGIISRDENGNLFADNEKLESLSEDQVKLITRDNFDDLVKVIKLQNYLTSPTDMAKPEANPADAETKALIEHMEAMKKRVEGAKKAQKMQDGDLEIDFADIISAVSAKSNSINKLNIWDLTIYQVYDEYSRLEVIDNYDFSIRAMLAGAEKVDLKHWSSRI